MAMYFHALVTCRGKQPIHVQLTTDQQHALAARQLPCPTCGSACAPALEFVFPREPIRELTWNGWRWGQTGPGE